MATPTEVPCEHFYQEQARSVSLWKGPPDLVVALPFSALGLGRSPMCVTTHHNSHLPPL